MNLVLKEVNLTLSNSAKAIIFISTLALIFDVVVFGNGKWSEVLLGFNFRKVVFLLLVISLFFYFGFERTLRDKVNFFLVLLPIFVFFIWSFCIPLIYGRVFDYQYTGNYDAILSDFRNPSSFGDYIFILNLSFKESVVLFAFSTLPLIAEFYRNNCRLWMYVTLTFFGSIFLLTAIHVNFVFDILICDYLKDYDCLPLQNAYSLYDSKSEAALNLVRPIYDVNNGSLIENRPIRFSVVSSIFMGVLLLYPFYIKIQRLSSSALYSLVMLLLTFAIFYTGLRGILLAVIFGFIVFVFLSTNLASAYDKVYRLVFILVALVTSLVFIASSSNVLSHFGLARSGSDSIRYTQGHVLMSEIINYPILGKGFGSVIENYQRLFSFEQYVLALVMKVGIVGLILFYFYMKTWIKHFQKREFSSLNKEEKNRYKGNIIGLISIFVLSTTNPYLMNLVGFVFILFFVVDHSVLTAKNKLIN